MYYVCVAIDIKSTTATLGCRHHCGRRNSYRNSGFLQDEIKLLTQIRDGDAGDDRCCCRLLDTFDHNGPHGRHVCMLFEVLGDNLLALIKRYKYRGIPLPVVRNISRQVLVGLDYMHR